MKKLFFITFLFGSLNCFSQSTVWFDYFKSDYFVSTTGNNNNSGTSPWQAWRTLAKLNSEQATMTDSSRISLKRGNFWNESIVIGKPTLIFKPFGTGNNPIIVEFDDPNNYTYTSIDIDIATGFIEPVTREFFVDPITGEYFIEP